MLGADAQPCGSAGDGKPAGDGELAHGVQVDVIGIGSRQVQAGAAISGRRPGHRLADAEVAQQCGGMVVQPGPHAGGERVSEGEVGGAVAGRGERECVPGVVQVGSGEQLEQVALGVT